jgi:hypothetical protein
MLPHEKPNFLKAVSEFYKFYKQDFSEFGLGLWWAALKNYDLAAILQGFERHMANPEQGKFMPKPADIIGMLQGSTLDVALVAWAKVDRALRGVGHYESVVFDDPLIHRVLQDMGGWVMLGNKTDDDWPFVAKEFENRYKGFRARSESPEYPSKLIGISEAANALASQPIAPPVLIGNPEKAKQVLLGGSNAPQLKFTPMLQIESQPITDE